MSSEKILKIDEELKIAVQAALERFRLNEEEKSYEFPSAFSNLERKFVHELCKEYGLKSKSKGKGTNRILTVTKRELVNRESDLPPIKLLPKTQQFINNLLSNQPLTELEKKDLLPRTERGILADGSAKENRKQVSRQSLKLSLIPKVADISSFEFFKETLPIYHMKEQILKLIDENRVIIIIGDTGSGKSTQVPQMILEEFCFKNKPCNIYLTQPRRLSTIALAERISLERNEVCGDTVGYQIRLEEKVSKDTILTVCTTGLLLRTLINGENINNVSHIIVDEVHERDKFTDFLLISLRELLSKQANLKLILMSASLNLSLFTDYFSNCPVVSVPGRMFDVKEFYLEDILKLTNYSTDLMKLAEKRLVHQEECRTALEKWCDDTKRGTIESVENVFSENDYGTNNMLDILISDAFQNGIIDSLEKFIVLVIEEKASVNYQHSLTTVSALMTAAARGWMNILERLIQLGSDVHLQTTNGWKALDFAHHCKHVDITEFLSALEIAEMGENKLSDIDSTSSVEIDAKLLKIYQYSFNDDKVDSDLILALLKKIHIEKPPGAILVFFPGIDDILNLRDKIESSDILSTTSNLFLLHSSISTFDQNRVFTVLPDNIRKIILSTNIAETSLTINDVTYVIDSGKVKEQIFDSITNTNCLKMNWISKSSALQRKGRAGRVRSGECYRIFSRARYANMLQYQLAEILRCPLEELCLHTKLLAPVSCSIADFLSKAIESPAQLVIKNAVYLLKQMDALDKFEDLTDLGCHLAELPLPPHCGKMILISIVLKCLDPILTIASCLSYREPFMLPTDSEAKRKLARIKMEYSKDSFSDHMSILGCYKAYQLAKARRQERVFCFQNFLSYTTMEFVEGTRNQLINQLKLMGFINDDKHYQELNINSDKWPVIKAALCSGFYPKLAVVDRTNNNVSTRLEKRVRFHPSSILNSSSHNTVKSHKETVSRLPFNWLFFDEMTRFNSLALIKCCTVVSPFTISLMAGTSRLLPHQFHFDPSDQETDEEREQDGEDNLSNDEDNKRINLRPTSNFRFIIDDWLKLYLDNGNASLIINVRQKLHALIVRKFKSCGKFSIRGEEEIIKSVVDALCTEDQNVPVPSSSGYKMAIKVLSSSSSTSSRKSNNSCRGADGNCSSSSSEERNSCSTPGVEGSSCRSSISSSPSLTPDTTASCVSSPVRYFVLKPPDLQIIQSSLNNGTWICSSSTKKVLDGAFKQCSNVSGSNVYLFVSVQGSGHFQGYLKMLSVPQMDDGKFKFKVEWMKRRDVHFSEVHNLENPWNDRKNVKISRDGQEIETVTGEKLIEIIEKGNGRRNRNSRNRSKKSSNNH